MIAPNLDACIDELDALRTRDDAWQIPRPEGELLHQIALSMRARTIVEVGTSYGFSGLWWLRALCRTDGVLHTIDASEKKYNASREIFSRAGVQKRVHSHLGDAREALARIEGPFDLAFIDADKQSTGSYFDLIWPNVRVGGAVLVDNATTHRRDLADYVKLVRGRTDASSAEVAVGNGIEWTIKLS